MQILHSQTKEYIVSFFKPTAIALTVAFTLPLAACATTSSTTSSAKPAAATPASTVANIAGFISKLEAARGTALSVAEVAAVSSVTGQATAATAAAQNKFLGAVSKTTGLDTAALGMLFPSATQAVSNSDAVATLEGKMGKKLSLVQSAGLKAANTLRSNSLASAKGALINGVAAKAGVDAGTVTALLPLLGF